MRTFGKLLLGLWVICLLLIILVPVIKNQPNIDFQTPRYEDNWTYLTSIIIPLLFVCPLLFLAVTKVKEDMSMAIVIVATLIIGGGIWFVVVVNFAFLDLCSADYSEVLFENLEEPEIKIVNRDFGCGAVDSSPNSKTSYEIRPFLFFFYKTQKVDLKEVDEAHWQPVTSSGLSH